MMKFLAAIACAFSAYVVTSVVILVLEHLGVL